MSSQTSDNIAVTPCQSKRFPNILKVFVIFLLITFNAYSSYLVTLSGVHESFKDPFAAIPFIILSSLGLPFVAFLISSIRPKWRNTTIQLNILLVCSFILFLSNIQVLLWA